MGPSSLFPGETVRCQGPTNTVWGRTGAVQKRCFVLQLELIAKMQKVGDQWGAKEKASSWEINRVCSGHHLQTEPTRGWKRCLVCCCLVAKSFLTLCDPMGGSPPGSSVHGISQARILERVAISFSRRFSQPRDGIRVSCIAGGFFTHRTDALRIT